MGDMSLTHHCLLFVKNYTIKWIIIFLIKKDKKMKLVLVFVNLSRLKIMPKLLSIYVKTYGISHN